MKKGYIFTLAIAFALALTSCNQAPAVSDQADSIITSIPVDSTMIVADTIVVDSSLLK